MGDKSQQNADLANDAYAYWQDNKLKDCVSSLKQIQKGLEDGENNKVAKAKVEHNLAIAEFASSGGKTRKDEEAVLDKFKAVTRQIEGLGTAQDAEDAKEGKGGIEKGKFQPDASFSLYNQAVIYVQLRKWHSALVILEDLFRYIDALDEGLALCICFLLLDVYTLVARGSGFGDGGVLLGHIVEKAQSVIDYLEKPHAFNQQDARPKSPKVDSEYARTFSAPQMKSVRARLNTYKYKLVLIQASITNAKAEARASGAKLLEELAESSAEDKDEKADAWLGMRLSQAGQKLSLSSASLHNCLKANMEYLNGDYATSHQLLRQCAGGIAQGLYWNNLGCLHHMLKQHRCGAMYFAKAFEFFQKQGSERVVDKCLPEVAFNLGIQLLHCGKPFEAYEAFSVAADSNYHRPRLWLHIAECVVMSYSDAVKRNDTGMVKGVVGQGAFRRILLNPDYCSNSDLSSEEEGHLPIHVGLRATSHVLFLLNKAESDSLVGVPSSTSITQSQEGASGAKGESSANNKTKKDVAEKSTGSIIVLESDADQCRQQARAMRHSALLCRAYLALLSRDWALAYDASKQVIESLTEGDKPASASKESGEILAIAHSYCVEALLHLNLDASTPDSAQQSKLFNHIVQAMEHGLFKQDDDNENLTSPQTRSSIGVNMALVRLMQGMYDEAERLLHRALEVFPDSPHPLRLLVYVYLQRGDMDRARRILKTSR